MLGHRYLGSCVCFVSHRVAGFFYYCVSLVQRLFVHKIFVLPLGGGFYMSLVTEAPVFGHLTIGWSGQLHVLQY